MTACIVLVSLGRHPVVGCPRLAPDEAAAVVLARRAGLVPHLLHAGPAENAASLRRGLGLGAAALEILALPAEADPIDPLRQRLAATMPALVLTGVRAESGEGSGMVPHLLGAALAAPVVSDCVGLEAREGGWVARCRGPGGARRLVAIAAPAIVSVAAGLPDAPLGSVVAARSGRVVVTPAAAPRDARHDAPARPARPVPPPLAAPREAEGGARILDDPAQAADAILAFLQNAGLRG